MGIARACLDLFTTFGVLGGDPDGPVGDLLGGPPEEEDHRLLVFCLGGGEAETPGEVYEVCVVLLHVVPELVEGSFPSPISTR